MNWQEILQSVNFPTTAVTLDFESYFDDDYKLKKLSTIEYVIDNRFEITGLGLLESKSPFDDAQNCVFWPANKVADRMKTLKEEYGDNLEGCTVVGQNLMFDCLILSRHFGIIPKHTVDVLSLARHEDSQRHNGLGDLCKYYKISIQKGDTNQFKGLTYKRMPPGLRIKLAEYCRGDIIAETELFRLLLPKLSRPKVELQIAHHTLMLYLRPVLNFDFKLADELVVEMQKELGKSLDKVKWILTETK